MTDDDWTEAHDQLVRELGARFAGQPIDVVLNVLAHMLLVGVAYVRVEQVDESWAERYCTRLGHLVMVMGDCPVDQLPAVVDGARRTH